ncbi:bifunctional ADP-dependent NAD(P)H-hydrate dehydratase/NAD(P)H-hydrate epimerase [Tatumella sp. UBA2305]|uniref:bifunctional ADP-dependent NAD(P)H-hydrate dehydratase/NAD(P)H-hydrate epimerase n=1 Tax=Tatumella sp. UBA2305 TaxID=1947647 RepID=UPI0025F36A8B|nr:bifunctional ADP-dependent NAD(P)H-hydrate dehydratase/NAD(P)H-hydrate epimerase [Tatumella sp. UBA2305]
MSVNTLNLPSLSGAVWPASQFPSLEQQLCSLCGISTRTLMERAGHAAFQHICRLWPQASHWRILCGSGNNGGDGYVVARLAKQAGLRVTLIACDSARLPEEAQHAREQWLACGGECLPADSDWIGEEHLIVDALLGIGLNRAPENPYRQLIEKVRERSVPVFALDIPSGVMADSGTVPGVAIKADVTLTFIGLKAGLLTGKARDYCGTILTDPLGPDLAGTHVDPPVWRKDVSHLAGWLPSRNATAHKGDHGKLVLIGGDKGTGGAIRLAGEAALRSGAGLVRVLTHPDNVIALVTARPELMTAAMSEQQLEESLEWADTVVIGPGLGQQAWGKTVFSQVKKSKKQTLWDADALNLLAIDPDTRQNRILTPHPGEAARLLGTSVQSVENDRLLAARQLVQRYGGVVVLKGAGTVISSSDGETVIADVGNPGMATGGMGDVLSGVIAALAGQKLSLYDAACAGVVAHGGAADWVARKHGMRGMLASDLFEPLRRLVNPE